MRIPPSYKLTPEIVNLIAQIEVHRLFFQSLDLPVQLKNNIQRASILKSSLYSARIEGNPLTMEDIQTSSDKEKKREVFNLLEAIRYIDKKFKAEEKIKKETILTLHKIVMKDINFQAGSLRKEQSAIFNQAGVVIYLPPPASELSHLMEKLFSYINSSKDDFPLITSIITHLVFEKIHPFLDGNGRVGRLLISLVLKSKKHQFPIGVSLEEYLEAHRDDYYYHLDIGYRHTNDYLLFMLSALLRQIEKLKDEVEVKLKKGERIYLPPRQEEIYRLIKDHVNISFDFIRRRFLSVPPRTLRYDLKKLQEKDLIVKIGTTRGSYYTLK